MRSDGHAPLYTCSQAILWNPDDSINVGKFDSAAREQLFGSDNTEHLGNQNSWSSKANGRVSAIRQEAVAIPVPMVCLGCITPQLLPDCPHL